MLEDDEYLLLDANKPDFKFDDEDCNKLWFKVLQKAQARYLEEHLEKRAAVPKGVQSLAGLVLSSKTTG